MESLLQRTCLRPSYSLRRQLLTSFGVTVIFSLTVVVLAAALCGKFAGERIKRVSDGPMKEQIIKELGRNSRFEAQALSAYFNNIEGTVQLMAEIVKDRISGYPLPGWEEDIFVPFLDRETNTNKYPLKTSGLVLEWNITANVNLSNAFEHVQEREKWLQASPTASTATPSYFMQGACDPTEFNKSSRVYYENCTASNNDVVTGGVVQPTSTNYGLFQKAADIGRLFKPLYETQEEVILMGAYFQNSGAGSFVHFPGHVRAGERFYRSAGCEWMRIMNNQTNRSFGEQAEIDRCHGNGENVQNREYNPLEREWYQEMALNENITWIGPFYSLGNENHLRLVVIGRSVFDRITGELIGVVTVELALIDLENFLEDHRFIEESNFTIVRISDDTVLADTMDRTRGVKLKVYDTGIISEENYYRVKNETLKNNQGVVFCLNTTYVGDLLPLPQPNETHIPPEFLVIQAVSNDVFDVVDRMNDRIELELFRSTMLALAMGCLGSIVIFGILFFVSEKVTKPLHWIDTVAFQIINHAEQGAAKSFVASKDMGESLEQTWLASKTISDLVREFKTMIQGFSGAGAAMVAHADLTEIRNKLTWQSDYQQLYTYNQKEESRYYIKRALATENSSKNEDTAGMDPNGPPVTYIIPVEDTPDGPEENVVGSIVPAPPKKNMGLNVVGNPKCPVDGGDRRGEDRSPLFWRILILLALPLALTIAAICTTVSLAYLKSIPEFRDIAEESVIELQTRSMGMAAKLKANEISMTVRDIVRDTHFVSRVAGWLFFEGLKRSDAFPYVEQAAEECKTYFADSAGTCPFFDDPERAVCACSWRDEDLYDFQVNCRSYEPVEAREIQHLFYLGQSRDADAMTGNRENATSFGTPGVDVSPSTTEWWSDIDMLPGAIKGSTASGFETTYDRLRVASAVSVAIFPVFNYATEMGKKKIVLNQALSFEADGVFVGFSGCNQEFANSSQFQATILNRASNISSRLCPEGKFGYDPRCRGWYASGKDAYFDNSDPLYITAPYNFAVQQNSAATGTAPIVNPSVNGTYIGQTLFDFYPSGVSSSLDSVVDGISFVITPSYRGIADGDVVIGPNRGEKWKPAWIDDELFPFEVSYEHKQVFQEDVLPKLKSGERGVTDFTRLDEKGNEEILVFAYEPVKERVLLPIDPADYSRGVNLTEILVYTVAIGVRYGDFIGQADDVDADLRRLTIAYALTIVVVSIILMLFAYKITVQLTRPVTTLLNLVQSINSGTVKEDIPPLRGGSKEISNVYNSFAKLYKIVRISNTAFFSGNLKWAYSSITDALKLFRRIGDEKAIGIACNNLGNTLQAMCRAEKTIECCRFISNQCILNIANEHYEESIKIAEKEFDEADTEIEKSAFAQQLADRLFNRGLFFLTIQGCNDCAPKNARARGLADFKRARFLDEDVVGFFRARDLLITNSTEYFLRLLRRAEGLLEVYDDREVRDLWDVDSLIREADSILASFWEMSSAPLFQDLTPVGRLQQLEAAAIKWDLCRGREFDASRLAMRMFAEDEYLLEDTFVKAASGLLQLLRDDDIAADSWTQKTKTSAKSDFRRMLRSAKADHLDVGKCLVFALEINERWETDELLSKVNENCLALYDDHCLQDDFCGIAGYTTRGDMNLALSLKSEHEGLQRSRLDLATSSTSESVCPSFPYAIQMLIDAQATMVNDTYILLIMDGFSWDSHANRGLKLQIETLNRERDTKIHVIILGMEIEESEVVAECIEMCSITKASRFIEIDLSNVGAAFELIRLIVSGGVNSRKVLSQGLTMETFSRKDRTRVVPGVYSDDVV